MIKFTEGGLIDIWPEKDPEIQALSYALQQQFKKLKSYADKTQCYSDVDDLDEEILDYFAVEMRSMYYEQTLPVEQKRNIVKNTLKWHIYSGTPETANEMVSTVFGDGEVVEWFDYKDWPYTPLALQADLEKLVARVTRIEQSKAKLLGARRKCNSSSTAWERFGDTADMVCQAAIGNADVRNDMMNEYPFNSMKPCNLAEDVTVNAYLGDPAFQWDGSNGDVMLEVPMCYTGRWFETDNNGVKWEYRAVSSAPINHLHLDHAFTDGESRRISEKIYIPIFNGSISSDGTKLESKANAYPVHNKNRDQFRQLAKKKGANWYLDDVWAMHLLDTFFIVMFADTNAQKILGNGQSSLPVSDADGKSLKARTGNYITVKKSYGDRFKPGMGILIGTNSIWGARLVEDRTVTKVEQSADTPDATDVYFDGEQAVIGTNHVLSACCQKAGSTIQMTSPNGKASEDVNAPVRFLWIEDWYGNGWQFRDGDNIKNWQHYYCNTRAAYADKKHDQEYFKVGYEAAHTNGYVKEFGYDPEWPEIEICTDATGSSNTYFPDYYAQAEGGEVVFSGGYVGYGTSVGPFYRSCSFGAGASIWYFLGRPQARK